MKGAEIARLCNVSTSTLKHYESWGLVPEVPRAENGYRQYTEVHAAYFTCIVKLNIGFGMKLVRKVMPMLIKGKTLEALWQINLAQSELQEQRRSAEQMVAMLDLEEIEWFDSKQKKKGPYTIGQVAKIANVTTSAIRHWEKEGLVVPDRHHENGYRIYSLTDIRRILIIRTVSQAAWSLDIVREVLSETEDKGIKRAKEMARQSLMYIDHTLVARTKAYTALNELLNLISDKEEIWHYDQLGNYLYYR